MMSFILPRSAGKQHVRKNKERSDFYVCRTSFRDDVDDEKAMLCWNLATRGTHQHKPT